MEIIRDLAQWSTLRAELSGRIGFVPTMGALHEGHASLLRRARAECDVSILSIFVNRAQFNDKEDFKNYPSTFSADIEMARSENVDFVLTPDERSLYPDSYRYRVTESDLSRSLCGAHRPGHFDGVLSVVMKLLNLTRPTRVYFGEKDYQQYLLIREMAEAFFMSVEVIACPTVREEDGLAMSSRNRQLSPSERKLAVLLPRTLRSFRTVDQVRTELEAAGFTVDYVEDRDHRRFVAATLGSVRLIDNVAR